MTGLVVWTVIDVLLLVAGLAFYLFWVGTLLTRIAGNLEECAEIVRTIVGHAKLIGPGVEHINETSGVVAGAYSWLTISIVEPRSAARRGWTEATSSASAPTVVPGATSRTSSSRPRSSRQSAKYRSVIFIDLPIVRFAQCLDEERRAVAGDCTIGPRAETPHPCLW